MALEIQYSDKQVSPWGGLALMKEMLDRSGIREQLSSISLPESTSNNSIDAAKSGFINDLNTDNPTFIFLLPYKYPAKVTGYPTSEQFLLLV